MLFRVNGRGRRTALFNEPVEASLIQHVIELGVERMTGASGRFRRGNVQFAPVRFVCSGCHVSLALYCVLCSINQATFLRAKGRPVSELNLGDDPLGKNGFTGKP